MQCCHISTLLVVTKSCIVLIGTISEISIISFFCTKKFHSFDNKLILHHLGMDVHVMGQTASTDCFIKES